MDTKLSPLIEATEGQGHDGGEPAKLDQLRQLILRIAPELGEYPLYVIAHPGSIPLPEDSCGYAVRSPGAVFNRHLRDTGQWRGPGRIVGFTDLSLPYQTLVSIAIHETAHALDNPVPIAIEESPAAVAENMQFLRAQAVEPEDVLRPRWVSSGHGKNFLRLVIHCWWRAAMIGEFVPVHWLYNGEYDYSSPGIYLNALGSEPVKMQHATFAEILRTEPPEEFTAVWKSDLKHWMDTHPTEVKLTMEGKPL